MAQKAVSYPDMGNEWYDVQERVFTRWCNTHLKKRDPPRELPIGSLTRGGLDDGIDMWELVTQISKEVLPGKPDRRGKMRIHHINNHDLVMKFVASKIKLVGMGPEDIVDRKRNLILGYIWTLILRYQIGGEGGSARQDLIRWLRSIGIMVNDLTSDFADGKQICNLVNKIRPGLIPVNQINDNAVANVQKALDVSLTEFDIPQVLDAEDMAQESPDELVNMTYLSYFRDKYQELLNAALAGVLGDNPRESQAKRLFAFQVKTTNVAQASAFDCQATDSKGKKFPVTITKAMQNDIWDFTFVPPVEGKYVIDIAVGKKPVKNAPMILNATPAAFASINEVPKAIASKPCTVKMTYGLGLKPAEIQFELIDSTGKPVPNVSGTFKDCGKGELDLVFIPPKEGQYKINVTYKGDGLPVKNSPAALTVEPKPQITGFGPKGLDYWLKDATATKPVTVPLDVVNLKVDDLKVTVTGPQGEQIQPVKVVDNKNGTFDVHFTPMVEGPHKFNIIAAGEPVKDLPKAFNVKPKPQVTGFGPKGLDYWLKDATATKPVTVPLDVVNLKPDDLVVTVTGPQGEHIKPIKVVDNGNGTFNVIFTPLVQGPHKFNIVADGDQVKDLPKAFNVKPKPTVTGFGPKGLDYWLKDATATKPVTVPLDVVNLKVEDLQVTVTGPHGEHIKPIKVVDNGNGTFNVNFTPLVEGPHKFNIIADGEQVKELPKAFNVKPKPQVTGFGPKGLDYWLKDATATKPVTVPLDVVNLKADDLIVSVTDPKGNHIKPVKVVDNGNGTFNVNFTPLVQGPHIFNIIADGSQVKELPKSFNVKPKPQVTGFGPKGLDYWLKDATATKPVTVPLDIINLQVEDVKVTVTDPEGKHINPITITDKRDGTFQVVFTPMVEGKHVFNIIADGDQVKDLPKPFNVKPKPTLSGHDIDYYLKDATATKPVDVRLTVVNLKPEDVVCTITDPKGNKIKPIKISDNKDGTFNINFTPMVEGPHVFDLIADGERVKDCPKKFSVAPKPAVTGFDLSPLDKAIATKPVVVPLNVVNITPDDLHVTITDPQGHRVPPIVKDNFDGTFAVHFTPMVEGPHKFNIVADGDQVKGLPKGFHVQPKPTVTGFGPKGLDYWLKDATATKPVNVPLDVVNLKTSDLLVSVTDPKGNNIKPIKVTDNKNGTFNVNFTPMVEGPHTFNIIADGEQVRDLPKQFKVAPKPSIGEFDPSGLDKAVATKPVHVPLEVINLKPSDCIVTVTDSKGNKIPATVEDLHNGKFDVKFTPIVEGPHIFDIIADGDPVKGLPKKFTVAPKPTASFDGPLLKAKATKPYSFPLRVVNVSPDLVDVQITDEMGLPAQLQRPPKVTDNGNGTFDVAFTPMEQGPHNVKILVEGSPIPGGPAKLVVEPKPTIKLIGASKRLATASKPFEIQLDAMNIDPNDLKHSVKDEHGNQIPVKVTTKPGPLGPLNQIYCLQFTPPKEGRLVCQASFEGIPVEDTPVYIEVAHKPSAKLDLDSLPKCVATKPATFTLDTVNLRPEDLKIVLTDEFLRTIPFKVTPNPDEGTMTIAFVPEVPGKILFKAVADGIPVEGTPLELPVAPKPTARLRTPPKEAIATKPYTFTLDTVNLKPEELKIDVTDASGKPVGPARIKQNPDGTFDVTFVPMQEGPHKVNVIADGNQVDGCPFAVKVQPKPTAKYSGPNNIESPATRPVLFKLDTINLKPDGITIDVFDESGRPVKVPFKVRELGPNSAELILLPQEKGPLKVIINADNSPIDGPPILLDVTDKPSAEYDGPRPFPATAGKKAKIPLSIVNIDPSELDVKIRDPKTGKNLPVTIDDNMDGTFSINFTPLNAGDLTAEIKLDGKPIDGAPIPVKVIEAPTAKYKGPKHGLTGTAGQPFILPMELVNCAPDQLDLDIRGPDNRPIPYTVTRNGPGTAELRFVPKDPGYVSIGGSVDGSPIDGFPLSVKIEEKPWAKVIGPSKRHTKVGDPLVIKLDTVNLKPADLDVQLPFNPKTKPTIKDNGDGTMTVTVVPDTDGPFRMSINLDGGPIEGCPLHVDVDKKTQWGNDLLGLLDDILNQADKFTLVPFSDLSQVGTNQPCLFHAIPDAGYASTATSIMFKATVVASEGMNPPALVKQTHTGEFEVRFVPQMRTRYILDVKLSDQSIKNSPMTVDISAFGMAGNADSGKSMRIGVAIPNTSAIAKLPFQFKIVYSDVPEWKYITCKVVDSQGHEQMGELQKLGGDEINVTVIPQIHGHHKVVPLFEGCVVSGQMGFECSPEPTGKVIGPADRNDGVVGQEYNIKIGAINCILTNFKFALKGPPSGGVVASLNLNPNGGESGITTKFTPQKGGKANPNGVENGIFDVNFRATVAGNYTFIAFLNGKPLTGAPVNILFSGSSSTFHGATTNVHVGAASPRNVQQFAQPSPRAQVQASSPRTTVGQPAQFGTGQPAQFGTGQPAQFGTGQPAQFGAAPPGQPAQFGGSSGSPKESKPRDKTRDKASRSDKASGSPRDKTTRDKTARDKK